MEELKRVMREAAAILDKTSGVLNADGTILACTDDRLEGTEDLAARAVVLSDETTVLSAGKIYQKLATSEKPDLITFIEGTDTIARSYLDLLSHWILSELREPDTDVERDAFLKNVLLENELPGDVPLKAREYKIQYTTPRLAFLVKIDQAEEVDCLEIVSNLFPDKRTSFVLAMDEETIVLLTDFPKEDLEFIDRTAATIMDTINAESLAKVRIGIGMVAESLKDAAKSYREASLALTVGNIFESDTYVMRYDKLGLGRLIYQLPQTLCHMFLDEVFPKGAYESLDSETLLTIQKFFENNLNGSETSRQLFVHRNTLVYRLDKVQKITGLDLRSFDDAVLFKLASMVRRYLEKQEKGSLKTAANKWWHS